VDDEFIQNQLQSLQMLQARSDARGNVSKPLGDSHQQATREKASHAGGIFGGDHGLNASQLSRAESAVSASAVSGISNANGVLTHSEVSWLAETGEEREAKRTCIAASRCWVAIGTSSGGVLVFHRSTQRLRHDMRLPFHSRNDATAATCLSICSSEHFLLSGHASGLVAVWELGKGALVRDLADAHAQPILEVCSRPDPQRLWRAGTAEA
jgi:hypothetical protein